GKRRFRVGILVAALAAAAVIADFAEIVGWVASWFAEDDSAPAAATAPAATTPTHLNPRRIAILYFDDFSKDQDLAYLANGLTESLITDLSGVQGLEVISRNGVKPYRDTDVTVDSIVRVLEPGTIVEGSVNRSEDRLRVVVQLIDALSNTHIDSRTIEKSETELFALLDEVTEEVQEFLREQLGEEIRFREIRSGTESQEAWTLVSRSDLLVDDGMQLALAHSDTAAARQTLDRADLALVRAESADPSWVLPTIRRGWLAFNKAKLGRASPASYDGEFLGQAVSFANDALRLAPGDPRALELRGTARFYQGWGGRTTDADAAWTAAEADLRAAVDADATAARAWAELGRLLLQRGQPEEAGVAGRRAQEADAFMEIAPDLQYNLAYGALERGEHEEAIRLALRGQKAYPQDPVFPAIELLTLATQGPVEPDIERGSQLSVTLEDKLPQYAAQWQLLLASVLVRAGEADSARAVIARASGSDDATAWAYEAQAHLLLGDRAAAIGLIARYLERYPQRRQQVAADQWWEPLHGDPDFEALLEEEG
ncbi:MAG: hypothetical protein JSV95_08850, partial [Gemmatimonadota bacterium]